MALVLKGVMQSTVTPLKPDFSPDLETFEKLVEFHVRTGATAIAWPHHKAESLNLTIAERKKFAEVAVKVTAGRVPVSIHVSALAVEDTMELARHAGIAAAGVIPGASLHPFPAAGRRSLSRSPPGAGQNRPSGAAARQSGGVPGRK